MQTLTLQIKLESQTFQQEEINFPKQFRLLLVIQDYQSVMILDFLNYSENKLLKGQLYLLILLLFLRQLEKPIGIFYREQEQQKIVLMSLLVLKLEVLFKVENYLVIVQQQIHGDKYFWIWNNKQEQDLQILIFRRLTK